MINILISFDDNDYELGEYFEKSYNGILERILFYPGLNIASIDGLNCTEQNINYHINAYSGDKFIFVGLSHGNEEELLTHNCVFVSASNNTSFNQSLFYTTACSSGKKLGKSLIDNGCITYVGYDDEVGVQESYYDVFIKCENYVLLKFLNQGISIKDAYDEMISFYNSEIDRLSLGTINDVIVAGYLTENRDCLTLMGNSNLRIFDLIA